VEGRSLLFAQQAVTLINSYVLATISTLQVIYDITMQLDIFSFIEMRLGLILAIVPFSIGLGIPHFGKGI